MTTVDNFIAQVPTQSASRSSFPLDPATAKLVDEFVTWLVQVDGKTRGSAASYRTYVSKPLSLGTTWEDMTSSERSGARKFKEFMASRKA